MAEPSDRQKIWNHGSNPYNAHETGESGSHWILLDGRRLYLRVTDHRSIDVMIEKNRTIIFHDTFSELEKEKKANYTLSPGEHTLIIQFSTGEEMVKKLQVN